MQQHNSDPIIKHLVLQPSRIFITPICPSSLSFRVDLKLVLPLILSTTDGCRDIEPSHLFYRKIMLDRGEGSVQSSESESESMEVPGEGTPVSLGSNEVKIVALGEGNDKAPDDKSLESEKEKSNPRASVLEYKSVSQMYVQRVPAIYPSHEIGCLQSTSWDKDTYGRKLVDSLEDSSKKTDKYEEFIFVVRRQYGAPVYGIYSQWC